MYTHSDAHWARSKHSTDSRHGKRYGVKLCELAQSCECLQARLDYNDLLLRPSDTRPTGRLCFERLDRLRAVDILRGDGRLRAEGRTLERPAGLAPR